MPEQKEFFRAGVYYQYGRGVPKDVDKAIECYRKAATLGSRAACSLLCIIYEERNDSAEELRWHKETALRGCFDSLWEVRKFYDGEEAAQSDLIEAYAWLSLYEDEFTGAKLSRELWCFQLNEDTTAYNTSSLDVAVLMSMLQIEHAEARYREYRKQRIKWLEQDADQGSPSAQRDLSWCRENGYGN